MIPEEFGLTVVVVAAKNLKNVSTFGKLDPFVQITYEKDVYKASVIKDGGCSPGWRLLLMIIFSLELRGLFDWKNCKTSNWCVTELIN